MNFDTGSNGTDVAAAELLGRLLVAPGSAEPGSGLEYEVSSFHDFSSYSFFLDPLRLRFEPSDSDDAVDDIDGSEIPVGVLIEFDEFASSFNTSVQANVEQFVWVEVESSKIIEEQSDYFAVFEPTMSKRRRVTAMALNGAAAFRVGMAPRLFAGYKRSRAPELYLAVARERVAAVLASWLGTLRSDEGVVEVNQLRQIERPSFWVERTAIVLAAVEEGFEREAPDEPEIGEEPLEELPPSYPFEPFAIGSVNFGLQLIYRQDWIALGTRSGEIVRTLPLGPQQTEKVSIKAVRKLKSARTSEIATSVETATESSNATKDSQEVVEEASNSFNWHTEASASASFGYGSAGFSAGMGGENASSSRDTKSTLNEAMEKTASKLRTDTKIVVSTEVEETSDFTRVSEISNPNDEIAVTYVYSRLQRQYELRTYLSDVNLVAFIGERVPAPSEVDGAWIRRYDWILSRVLLDESFRADLDAIRAGRPSGAEVGDGIDPAIESVMDSLSSGIPDYADVSGRVPDFFQNPQQAYERELERSRARSAADRQYYRSLNRVRLHIFDNVLHYMRAIWSSEDPDQRLLRYSQIRVATNWEFVTTGTPTSGGIPGYYAPAIHSYERDTAPLSEMINPTGPIGYAGNYAAFYLKESTRWSSLLSALGHLQAPYLRVVIEVEAPNGVEVTAEAAETRLGPGTYRLTATGDTPMEIAISQHTGSGVFEPVALRAIGNEVRFHGLVVRLANPKQIEAQQEIVLRVRLIHQLDDPELKAVRVSSAPPLPGDAEAEFFNKATISTMTSMFSGVRHALLAEFASEAPEADARQALRDGVDWNRLGPNAKDALRDRYYDYILRSRHSRRILVDTNNLLLTREVDATPTLEPFKALHRAADVLTVYEDLTARRRENDRLQRRLDADRLGDPDVDKLTVVTGSNQVNDLAALDTLSEDPTGAKNDDSQ